MQHWLLDNQFSHFTTISACDRQKDRQTELVHQWSRSTYRTTYSSTKLQPSSTQLPRQQVKSRSLAVIGCCSLQIEERVGQRNIEVAMQRLSAEVGDPVGILTGRRHANCPLHASTRTHIPPPSPFSSWFLTSRFVIWGLAPLYWDQSSDHAGELTVSGRATSLL